MKVLTWNINGIRASKIPVKELLCELDADIICLQETKVTRDQLEEFIAVVDGYNSYFSFSTVKSGYSGVATFVKDAATPIKAEEGLTGLLTSNSEDSIGNYGNQDDFTEEELESLDKEGRAVLTQHQIMTADGEPKLLTVINVYCPRADPDKEDRKAFKIRFYKLLQMRGEEILKNSSHVIILGDINTSHRQIDHCDPDDIQEFVKNPGRAWLDQLLVDLKKDNVTNVDDLMETETAKDGKSNGKFVDTFRFCHPNQTHAFTCWSTVTGARATNYGTRIDYIFADKDFAKTACQECVLMPEVEGSDHCPVKATFNCEFMPSQKCPRLCTKYLPEFAGKQQKLSAFFTKSKPAVNGSTDIQKNYGGKSQGSEKQSQNSNNCFTKEADLKRSASDPGKMDTKRLKKEDRKPSSGTQVSLMNFFAKRSAVPAKVTSVSPGEASVTPVKTDTMTNDSSENSSTREISTSETESAQPENTKPKPEKHAATKSQAALWKNMLKGPPPPPLCKGHQERCVLRTVKKDSLNKGRQFYVCNRPEGHKTNPEARCDHFEWVVKDKKKGEKIK